MIRAWADRKDLTFRQTVSGIARYWLAYGSVLPAAAAGLVTGILSGSRWAGINATGTIWGELASGLTGIDMDVQGEEHLWSSRPCVFIINHQSACDVFLCARLLRRDTFGIAKKEIRDKPVVGFVIDLMGTVFIDRANRVQAVHALGPAVRALRRHRSMLIAPEGTRSPDGRLLPFKKGAFHVAMEARVPIVPIVFHDSWKRLHPHSGIVRPGRVRVTVLPPIPTKTWKASQLDRHMEAIRQLYLDTLASKGCAIAGRPRHRRASKRPPPVPRETETPDG
jgi:putative phosphoserine phosphatase/1-acylglycerol-3-phosphate O-acyltransferase